MKLGALGSPCVLVDSACFARVCAVEARFARGSILDGTYAEVGLPVRGFLAGDSRVVGRVVVEAFFCCVTTGRDGLEVLAMESRILWNFRFVVLSATGIVSGRINVNARFGRVRLRVEDVYNVGHVVL